MSLINNRDFVGDKIYIYIISEEAITFIGRPWINGKDSFENSF